MSLHRSGAVCYQPQWAQSCLYRPHVGGHVTARFLRNCRLRFTLGTSGNSLHVPSWNYLLLSFMSWSLFLSYFLFTVLQFNPGRPESFSLTFINLVNEALFFPVTAPYRLFLHVCAREVPSRYTPNVIVRCDDIDFPPSNNPLLHELTNIHSLSVSR